MQPSGSVGYMVIQAHTLQRTRHSVSPLVLRNLEKALHPRNAFSQFCPGFSTSLYASHCCLPFLTHSEPVEIFQTCVN